MVTLRGCRLHGPCHEDSLFGSTSRISACQTECSVLLDAHVHALEKYGTRRRQELLYPHVTTAVILSQKYIRPFKTKLYIGMEDPYNRKLPHDSPRLSWLHIEDVGVRQIANGRPSVRRAAPSHLRINVHHDSGSHTRRACHSRMSR
jgi:hypothetical protein